MKPLFLLVLCLLLTACGPKGCQERANDIAPPTPGIPSVLDTPLPGIEAPKKGSDGKTDPLAQAKYDAQRYAEAAAQAEARYETMKKQAADDSIRSQVAWITGLCLLFAAICGVMAFITPVCKKTLVAAAAGFATVAACAQAFQWAVPYLPWIGGVVLIGGGIWAAVNWKKLGDSVKSAADHGDRLEDWLKTDLINKLPGDLQEQAAQIVSDVKTESKKQAERLGVDRSIQVLRGKTATFWQRLRA